MTTTHPHIVSMLEKYNLTSIHPVEALREILQEIILYALSKTDFFDHAVFYGGTALRILYGLPRYSEDLDFSLLKEDSSFDLLNYEKVIVNTLATYGFEAIIQHKKKSNEMSQVKSAFLKGNTLKHLIAISAPDDVIQSYHPDKTLKIKFEVDTVPPLSFNHEEKLHLSPAPFQIKTMAPSSLFAGKMHAILCRGWASRPKGRDWYDLIWYATKGYELDLTHLATRMMQKCTALENAGIELPSEIDEYSKELVMKWLNHRIDNLDVDNAKNDIKRFISDQSELDIWSVDFFKQVIKMIKFA